MTQNELNFLPYAARVAAQDKAIAELRLEALKTHVHQLEYQVDWYERAPLSWLLKKTVRAFDNAVRSRMTREPRTIPVFDGRAALTADGAPSAVLRKLSESYQHSVTVEQIAGRPKAYYVLLPVWFIYRLVRKIAKMTHRAIRRAG